MSQCEIKAAKRRDKSRREIVIKKSRTMNIINIIPENLISSFYEHFVISYIVHVCTSKQREIISHASTKIEMKCVLWGEM